MASDRVRIQDIARVAGVSNQTVSRVLNHKPDVSIETRERIEAVIKQLGYRPSDLARGLRNKNTRTIGLVVPDSANPFFAEIAKGVENGGFAAGYSVILCNSAQDKARELEHLELLRAKGVDGIIFIATSTEIDHIGPLIDSGIPVALFYREAPGLNVDTFAIDNRLAGALATQHLTDLGHRQIACIRPRSDKTPSGQRVAGYRAALEAVGVSPAPRLMPRGDNLIESGARAALELLDSGEPFTAIFASNDAMAIGALRALRDRGLRVPDDISLVGVDDILLASFVDPPLTTVAQDKQVAGERAVASLIERIEGRYTGGRRENLLGIQLIVRRSAAPLSKRG